MNDMQAATVHHITEMGLDKVAYSLETKYSIISAWKLNETF